MDPRTFPTKGNLMLAKNSLALAKQGYELMDKKRNILIRELMELIDQARTIQFSTTKESADRAAEAFRKVKDLTVKLSMVENAAYRLASNIKKTQKRANALQNITIPMYTGLVTDISNALEEKDREEFTRLKVIKRRKQG